MNLEIGRDFLVQLGKELLELRWPVAAVERADALATGGLKGGEQGRGAGLNVVVDAAFGSIGHYRQDRLGPVQRLDL
ncbi:hypothetical protein OG462_42760 [Streptomyces sp. NBC_01077]|uniref:hypothetical protein n=1 Tax=Streptomyces sp. NBC_01077 TaxID=2903746 RepID=UPI00386DE8AA|nr:hypothetical protein OG462_02265 [Streptomyces sp. NBC_01077]WSV43544.1 hypothetical protein OG462_42760 [Streptomyces sp. NBC_01077]